MIPFNHLILCCPLLLLPSVFPSIRVFSSESALCIRWPKYWSFSFSISPSNEYSGLICFRTLLLLLLLLSCFSCVRLHVTPIDGSLPDSPVPGILQARTLEWVAISFSNAWKWKLKVKSLSRVQLLETPWTAAHRTLPTPKKTDNPCTLMPLAFQEVPHSVCEVYFSLNKSTSYLPFCLSLNSFCNETLRSWVSLSPETRCLI